ncbi:zinc finger protein 665-like isoform X1 [Cotesia glomerata]|uniref:Uncharacterized protein n=1 Tax=Cotesia glomerata TaxID=32391 RepID=A0AAV7HWS4_COTGL|nr:zinc finger protein 665-like isoform X1 [Cotesia glomerata]XP_044587329.1 zinc finger protein 665-like isoform X1 [Cotesia glomerata]KAH0535203.1 hypothetical protein KQX54_014855 [Cotesia glomerata]
MTECYLDFDRVCRICLTESTNLTSLYCNDSVPGVFPSLSQRISTCGAIELNERDGLPSLICENCIYKASVAHDFREQCQNSDARLRLCYDKPARLQSNLQDSSTQTEIEERTMAKNVNSNYFVKQEIQGFNQDLNTIGVYQNPQVEVTSNQIVTDDKLFLCNIDYQTKELEKQPVLESTQHQNQQHQHQHQLQHQHQELDHQDIQHQVLIPEQQQVSIAVAIETGQRLPNSVTMAEMKPVVAQYVDNELLVNNDDSVEDEDLEDEEEETEIPGDGFNKEQDISIDLHEPKWEEESEELVPSKRLTRKAKDIAGKSYSVDEIDEDLPDNNDDDDDEPKFKCKVCSKRYNTSKGLKNHAQVHDKKHKCHVCLKSFYNLENMEKHVKIHETKPHACQLCHTCFAKPQSLVRHLKSHSDKIQGSNNNNIKSNENGTITIVRTEDTEDDDDDRDGFQTNETDEFDSAPGLYKCSECNQFCSTLKNLKRHSLIHGDKKYSCTVCKKYFFRPDTLKKHAEKHGHGLLDNLSDENKLYESDDETFNRSNTLANNINGNGTNDTDNKKIDSDEDGSGEYKCQHCDKVMATKKGLRRHVSMHKPKAEPVTCEICKKVCASQARLVLHQKTHSKPKEKVPREYLCHICSKVYPSNSSLTYHMRTHTGVKPHVCQTCNSGFTTTTSLANHIRIHTGDKPFVCHVCSAAFAVSSAFRRHLTRHTGEANYLCKTCGKAFKRLSTLKEHTYTHSGEKPYVCKTCGAAYSHSGSLFAHQKRCRVQYGEMVTSENNHSHVPHHIHVNNVQTAVRSLAVIGQMF